MDRAAEMNDRHARMLGRLAELGMALAEDLQAAALAAEDADAKAQLAAGFHRLSRSVRQSMALEARLLRDEHRQERETEAQARALADSVVTRRHRQAKARLERLVWTEAEDELTARHWDRGLERLLAEAEALDAFANRSVDEIVADLAAALRAQTPPAARPIANQLPNEWIWKIVDPQAGTTLVRRRPDGVNVEEYTRPISPEDEPDTS